MSNLKWYRLQMKAVTMISGLQSMEYEDKLKKIWHYASFQTHAQLRWCREETVLSDALNIITTRWRTEVRRNFFPNRVAEKWNKLPEYIKRAGNIKTFKYLYDKIPEQQEWETYE